MTNDRISVTRPNDKVKSEDRVYFLFTSRPNGIHILTRSPEVFATPEYGVAATDRPLFGVLVRLRGSRDNRYTQFVDTIATKLGYIRIGINAVGVDIVFVAPFIYRSLRKILRLIEVVGLCLV